MKYINQKDYPHWLYITRTGCEPEIREKGKTTTVATSGCGLCSSIMVADRLIPNCEFGLKDAVDLSYAVEANDIAGTNFSRYAPAFAEKMGLRYETSADIQALKHCLLTGGAAIVLVGGDREDHVGLFTHGRHYMAVVGTEPDGRFAILDPALYPGKFEEEGRQGKVELKCGVIALCTEQVLTEETRHIDPCFFLFWRA